MTFKAKYFCVSYYVSYYLDLSTQPANCTTGDVRLIGTENVVEGTKEGTVGLCVNAAWGTVCNDIFFDSIDAGVICQQLGGFYREGKFSIIATSICRLLM